MVLISLANKWFCHFFSWCVKILVIVENACAKSTVSCDWFYDKSAVLGWCRGRWVCTRQRVRHQTTFPPSKGSQHRTHGRWCRLHFIICTSICVRSTRTAHTSATANVVQIRSLYGESRSGSGWLPKFNGVFLFQGYICRKIFMKIQLRVLEIWAKLWKNAVSHNVEDP